MCNMSPDQWAGLAQVVSALVIPPCVAYVAARFFG